MTVANSNPPDHPPMVPSYSHISAISISPTKKLVSLAGQVGTVPNSTHTPTLPQQIQNALANVDKCLHAAGARKRDIVSVRQYVVRMSQLSEEDRRERGRIYVTWWQETEGEGLPPPSTLIGVESLATEREWYEIEVQCVVDV